MKSDSVQCFLCPSLSTRRCDHCEVAHCEDHQQYHKVSDGECGRYRVVSVPGSGRGLVSTSFIPRGHLILAADPAASAGLGPGQCVECCRILSLPQHCSECWLPVCSAECSAGSRHAAECEVLAPLRTEVGEEVWRENTDRILQVLLTLRIVSLKWRSPAQWSLLQLLAVDKTNEKVWQILSSLHSSVLHLDPRLTEDDLRTALGWQTTNGANLHLPPGHGRAVGVFPVQAFLNHDCRSNTETLEHPVTHQVQIYAREDIPAGTQLTTSYVSSALETNQRRQQLYEVWNFWCACLTCRDNTDRGSYRSAVACPLPCPGPLLARDPLDLRSDWVCQTCTHSLTLDQVDERLATARLLVSGLETADCEELERIVFRLTELLHHTHHLLLQVKQKLLVRLLSRSRLSRYMRAMDRERSSEVVTSQRYLGIRLTLVNTQLENLMEDYRRGAQVKQRLAEKMKECEELGLIMTKLRRNKS